MILSFLLTICTVHTQAYRPYGDLSVHTPGRNYSGILKFLVTSEPRLLLAWLWDVSLAAPLRWNLEGRDLKTYTYLQYLLYGPYHTVGLVSTYPLSVIRYLSFDSSSAIARELYELSSPVPVSPIHHHHHHMPVAAQFFSFTNSLCR